MSTPQNRTMENPAREPQNEVRKRVLKKAQIVFKGRGAAIDCVVLNLADRSACLKVESPIGIPDSFDLVLDHATVGNCRVTWRKATQIGVEFVHPTSVDNHLALRAAREAERLRRSEDHLARAQRTAHTGSIEQDLRTGVIEWSGETYRIFGLDPNLPAPTGEAFLALFHPDDRAACETEALAHQAAAGGQLSDKPRVDLHFRIVQPGGAVRRVHHESELVLDQHGAAVRWIGTYKDVTEAYEAEESFKLVFEGNPVPMWLFDPETLKFLAVNDAVIAHYGYDKEFLLALTLLDILPQKDRDNVKNAIRNTPQLSGGDPSHVWQHVKADGTAIDVLTYWRHTTFCGRPAQLVAIVDVTAKRAAEARITHMAHHDALTGLPNRVLFHDHLEHALLGVRR